MIRSGSVLLAAASILCGSILFCGSIQAADQSRLGRLQLVDGSTVNARVQTISPDFQLVVELEKGGERKLSLDQLVAWGRYREGAGPSVLLVDGSQVAGDILRYGAKTLSIGIDYETFSQRSVWEPSQIPLEHVRGVVFHSPGDLRERDALLRWLQPATAKTDRIRLINGDELSGAVLRVSSTAEESVRDEGEPNGGEPNGEERPMDDDPGRLMRIRLGGRDTSVVLKQVRAVALNPALARAAPPSGRRGVLLGFRNGSNVYARGLAIKGTEATVTTLSGASLKTTTTRLIRDLALIQPLDSDHVAYLSDLKALGYRHVPFLATRWPKHGVDRSVLDGRLRTGGYAFAKGLAMHSASRLAFALPAGYSRFEADLAVDEIVGESGSVVFRVYLDDGGGKFRSAYVSPVIRGGDAVTPMSIEIQGAKRLALIVDFADRGDAGDHANWLNARLVK